MEGGIVDTPANTILGAAEYHLHVTAADLDVMKQKRWEIFYNSETGQPFKKILPKYQDVRSTGLAKLQDIRGQVAGVTASERQQKILSALDAAIAAHS